MVQYLAAGAQLMMQDCFLGYITMNLATGASVRLGCRLGHAEKTASAGLKHNQAPNSKDHTEALLETADFRR